MNKRIEIRILSSIVATWRYGLVELISRLMSFIYTLSQVKIQRQLRVAHRALWIDGSREF